MSQMNPNTPMAIAKLLRYHSALKQRKGLLQGKPTDFFRFKRFVRALKSQEYSKKSMNQPDLYPVLKKSDKSEDGEASYDEDLIRNLFVGMIKTQLILPCTKLHSQECKEHGVKPNKDYPNLIVSQKAVLQDDVYYIWNYNPKTWLDIAMVVGVIVVILALVCFPLWPKSMRVGSYYLSLGSLGLLGVFFGMAIVRLVLYLLSLVFFRASGGFWLFPNLFEDCGVLESFKPLYGFGDDGSYSHIKKLKRKKRKLAKQEIKQEATNKKVTNDVKKITGKPKLEEVKDEL